MTTTTFTKILNITCPADKEKAKLEIKIELQKISSTYGFTPKIIETIFEPTKCTIIMENLNEMCLGDKYGDQPDNIWD